MDLSPTLIAQLDFRPVPSDQRRTPGRVKSLPARLYIDKYIEHREAYQFVQQQQDLHGEGSRTFVRALLHYNETVIKPLEAIRNGTAPQRRNSGNASGVPDELLIAQLSFRVIPEDHRQKPGRIKHVSARLYIDKYIEHRLAYEFVASQQELHGEGLKTLVRALLHYRDTVVKELQKNPVNTGRPQLALDTE